MLLASAEQPKLESLDARLKCAYKMFESMPDRLDAKNRGPKKTAFVSYRSLKGFGYM